MQRYFIHPDQIKEHTVTFLGEDLHHMVKVMRFEPGDQVIACDGTGRDVHVVLETVSKEQVVGTIVREIEENRELPISITLAQGLAKGEKMDWIIQKATEMGVAQIIPFTSARTIVKLNEKKEANRITRWQKITKEAAEQSHRSKVPLISEVVTFEELIKETKDFTLSLIAYEQERDKTLPKLLQNIRHNDQLLILVGPEGGFSEQEVELAKQHGIHSISLGKRILRTETAGIAALAYCGYQVEQLDSV